MKNLLGTSAVIAVLAAGAAFVGYRANYDSALHAAVVRGDTMEWLRVDFHLKEAQVSTIRQMQASYAGTCEEHCRMIQEATHSRNALQAAHGDKAAIDAANAEIQRMRTICESAIEAHIRRVAALMSPDDGKRYLALVLPKIASFDHLAAPDLLLNRAL